MSGRNKKEVKIWHILFSIVIIMILLIMFAHIHDPIEEEKNVREAVFAGSWYPDSKDTLSKAVQGYLDSVKKIELNSTIKAVIVPHAGYQYSGQVAAVAFKQLEDIYEAVFLLGPSHRYALRQASILDVTHYSTPLGEVKISWKAKKMLNEELITSIPDAHAKEHSLEIEIPFLQKQLSDFELVPILIGSISDEQFKDILLKYVGENDLIVVSVDLSHYHSYDEALQLDGYTIDKILKLDYDGIYSAEIDAQWAVAGLLRIAREKDWKPRLLYYANSGDVSGDKSSVVGYSAIVFLDENKERKEKELLTSEEQDFLLELARETIEIYLSTGKKPEIDDNKLSPALKKVQGCFTTLNKNRNLRGCIGHISPQEELYKCVIDNAISAAANDRRFKPVTYDELKDIEIEISVLTVPERLEFSSGDDLKSKLRPLVDGVVLKKGFYQSTYLPHVWEQIPDKGQFLSNLCSKGGMGAECWKDNSTEVYTYQAFVFSE